MITFLFRINLLFLLLPPWIQTSAEVLLCPGFKHNLAIIIFNMCKSKGQRGRTTYYFSCGIILRSMAWANELVGSLVPWHDTTQMGTHCIQAIALNSILFSDNPH